MESRGQEDGRKAKGKEGKDEKVKCAEEKEMREREEE